MIYIYALACPVTGRVRYVGKCKNKDSRLKAHISKARSGHTTHHCARWINTLLSRGRKPVLRVLMTLPNGADWQAAERQTIARYRRHGFDLTNLTGGGDGFHKQSPEMVRRRSQAHKLWFAIPENKAKMSAAFRAAKSSPEFRKKFGLIISASWRNPVIKARFLAGIRSPEVRLRRSVISVKMFADPEFRRAHAERLVKLWSTPERRQQAKDRSITLHSDPEIVERRRASLRSVHQRPDMKIKFAAIRAEVAARPEVRQKKSEALRKSWADPQSGAIRREAMASEHCRAKMSESAKKRWADPNKRIRLLASRSTPGHRAILAEIATLRATPEYRAMMAVKTRAAWASGKRKKKDSNVAACG